MVQAFCSSLQLLPSLSPEYHRWADPKPHRTGVSCPLPASCAARVALCPRFLPCWLLTHVCFSGCYLPLSRVVASPGYPPQAAAVPGRPTWHPPGLSLLPPLHTLSPQTLISRAPLPFCPALWCSNSLSHTSPDLVRCLGILKEAGLVCFVFLFYFKKNIFLPMIRVGNNITIQGVRFLIPQWMVWKWKN